MILSTLDLTLNALHDRQTSWVRNGVGQQPLMSDHKQQASPESLSFELRHVSFGSRRPLP